MELYSNFTMARLDHAELPALLRRYGRLAAGFDPLDRQVASVQLRRLHQVMKRSVQPRHKSVPNADPDQRLVRLIEGTVGPLRRRANGNYWTATQNLVGKRWTTATE